jgi:CDP-diacylglycerol--glycerol-3-phosphate 3-phosphatidyltransferase
VLPQGVARCGLWALDHVARALIALGATANSVTIGSVVLAATGGLLLALGHFGWAAVAMVAASLGDALDGLVARRTGSASVAGALLDASVDRYEEFFFLAGLSVYLHEVIWALLLALAALAGSFMVSYGSAKAEALRVPVPPGAMRRVERAVVLCAGVTVAALLGGVSRTVAIPPWGPLAPLYASLAIVAIVSNVSAIRRLRSLARSAHPAPAAPAPAPIDLCISASPRAPLAAMASPKPEGRTAS